MGEKDIQFIDKRLVGYIHALPIDYGLCRAVWNAVGEGRSSSQPTQPLLAYLRVKTPIGDIEADTKHLIIVGRSSRFSRWPFALPTLCVPTHIMICSNHNFLLAFFSRSRFPSPLAHRHRHLPCLPHYFFIIAIFLLFHPLLFASFIAQPLYRGVED